MKCDLHIHTNLSDGRSSLEEVLASSINNDVNIISITDHTIFDAYKLIEQVDNLKLITGIELSVIKDNNEYHFVMYNFDINNKYIKDYEKTNRNYDISMFKKILKILEVKYEFIINEDKLNEFIDNNIYFDRERINKLLYELNIVNSTSEAYIKYTYNIKDHPRYCISLEELFELEKNTNSIVSLAHPTKYFKDMEKLEDFVLYLKHNYNLRVLECITTRANIEQQQHLIEFCKKNDLYISGGSDFHAKIDEFDYKKIGYANGDIIVDDLTIFELLK